MYDGGKDETHWNIQTGKSPLIPSPLVFDIVAGSRSAEVAISAHTDEQPSWIFKIQAASRVATSYLLQVIDH